MSTDAINPAALANEKPADYRRIYVWEIPVRIYHWVNAICIVALCITGYMIGAPTHLFYAAESYQLYWFGWVRFIHFTSAFVYIFVTLGRVYWAFAGNKYARWENFIPLTRKQWENARDVIMVEMLQLKQRGLASTGHNTMAATSYFFMFLAFIFQTITGLALYSSMSNSRLVHLFNWIVPLFGGDAGVRFWHHLFLWLFVAFIVVHVYLTLYDDYVEGHGEISSMVSGWKFKRDRNE